MRFFLVTLLLACGGGGPSDGTSCAPPAGEPKPGAACVARGSEASYFVCGADLVWRLERTCAAGCNEQTGGCN